MTNGPQKRPGRMSHLLLIDSGRQPAMTRGDEGKRHALVELHTLKPGAKFLQGCMLFWLYVT